VTDAKAALVEELVGRGLVAREATWLVDEFFIAADPDFTSAVMVAAERRLAGEPLQYIVGHWPFRHCDLDLDARVLIPRPETEELVDIALRELALSRRVAPLIADLGTGSGAIIVSVLGELHERGVQASGVAVDISDEALSVARRNARKHHLTNVSFVTSSWWREVDTNVRGRFDLVTANPPYIARHETHLIDPELAFEPSSALFADDALGTAGFADVADIITTTGPWLSPVGVLIVEHGFLHGPAAVELARSAGFASATTVTDMAGHDRFLVAKEWS
jgi:release factor glutamine methyltransferase